MATINSPNGDFAQVTAETAGRLLTHSRRNDSELDQVLAGEAYTLYVATVTPTGADDCYVALSNTSPDFAVVTRIQLEDAGAEELYWLLSDAYTLATTHAVFTRATNRGGFSNLITNKGDYEQGVDITGRTGTETELMRRLTAAGTLYPNILDGTLLPGGRENVLVIPPGKALNFMAATGTAAITHVAIDIHFVMTPRS
jgi:hypothetical protein